MEYEKLGKAAEELEGLISPEDLFHLCLVALGEKPAGLVMSIDRGAEERLGQETERLGMDYEVRGDERPGFMARLLGRNDRFSTRGFFYARDESRFDILDESDGKFYGGSEEAVGRFLGYPEESIEYYTRDDEIGSDTIERIKEEFKGLELGYLALVGYIPAPEKEQVEKAVEEGKRRAQLMDDIVESFPRGRELKEELMDESPWS